jgi:hypothetical protein
VNIRWNSALSRFEAEFSSDFSGDLAAVKEAKFHTDGAPGWVWYAPPPGVKALNRLRAKRPASGLTITSEAREQYAPLAAQEAKNEEIKAAAKKAEKEQKKSRPQKSWVPEKGYLDASDFPPSTYVNPYVRPPQDSTAPRCIICEGLLELFLYADNESRPVACLWCSKLVLDNVTEVC